MCAASTLQTSHTIMTMVPSDKTYLCQLFNKAVQFSNEVKTFYRGGLLVTTSTCVMEAATVLYRNKHEGYFQDILQNNNGIMGKTVKDYGGDPRCPINGRLEGLFFGVTLFQGNLPTISPFGNTRVLVRLEDVFDKCTNLYFADFYCMSMNDYAPHYVTLVAAKTNTQADLFCQVHLIQLDLHDNVFLRKHPYGFSTLKKKYMWVEIFYTEDMDIGGKELISNMHISGQGYSTPGGIPKNIFCLKCNI